MIWIALVLGTVGLSLSAFFSGSETGFYRAARIRLVLDALGGDRVARGLVWLANRPSMFVATTLVGNNLANYLTSLAIVLATSWTLESESWLVELMGPIVLAPVLFVYGELMPKYLFLHAPNRLLRRVGGPFLVFTVLFLPVSILLWVLNRTVAGVLGESPEKVRLRIARRELRGILEEGHDVGILYPAQKKLASGIFVSADHTVRRHAAPLGEVPRARAGMSKAEICGLASRFKLSEVPIEDAEGSDELKAYVRVIDLALSGSAEVENVRPMMTISAEDTPIEALIRMHTEQENMARVVDAEGQTVGLVYASRLRQQLLKGQPEKRNSLGQRRVN
jgi:CBS domain containing-hemolysin-like protein